MHSMDWSYGAECWSGVLEWSGVRFLSGKMLGTVFLPGITNIA